MEGLRSRTLCRDECGSPRHGVLSRHAHARESDQLIENIESHFDNRGFGLFATELKAEGKLIGFIGLHVASFQAHFTPCVEIGWRIAVPYWGKGLATEGSREVIRFAFDRLKLENLVSFTVPENVGLMPADGKAGDDAQSCG
jgi:RimJ/RimL family protein N-acetyltransferase